MRNNRLGSRLQEETLRELDAFRRKFNNHSCIVGWYNPEVTVLEDKKILLAPSGPFWIASEERPHQWHGCFGSALRNAAPIEVIEDEGYVFGGEELAQAILIQLRCDARHK